MSARSRSEPWWGPRRPKVPDGLSTWDLTPRGWVQRATLANQPAPSLFDVPTADELAEIAGRLRAIPDPVPIIDPRLQAWIDRVLVPQLVDDCDPRHWFTRGQP